VRTHETKAKAEAKSLAAAKIEPHHDRVLLRIYEAEDGFTGTYEEVLAHEQKNGLSSGNEHAASVQHVLGTKTVRDRVRFMRELHEYIPFEFMKGRRCVEERLHLRTDCQEIVHLIFALPWLILYYLPL